MKHPPPHPHQSAPSQLLAPPPPLHPPPPPHSPLPLALAPPAALALDGTCAALHARASVALCHCLSSGLLSAFREKHALLSSFAFAVRVLDKSDIRPIDHPGPSPPAAAAPQSTIAALVAATACSMPLGLSTATCQTQGGSSTWCSCSDRCALPIQAEALLSLPRQARQAVLQQQQLLELEVAALGRRAAGQLQLQLQVGRQEQAEQAA
jgi:hypothetical protein